MKKFIAIILSIVIVASFASCGNNQQETNGQPSGSTTKKSSKVVKYKTFEEIETAIEEDETKTATDMKAEIEKINEKVNNFDDYNKVLENIKKWYESSITAAKDFYARIREYTIAYYKMIAKDIGLKDYSEWNKAIKDCYDAWDDALKDFYNEWDDLYKDIYRKYDDIIKDGYDLYNYDKVADAWSDMYDMYSDNWSDMYDEYSDAWSDLYDDYDDIYGDFYDGEDDVDEILDLNK